MGASSARPFCIAAVPPDATPAERTLGQEPASGRLEIASPILAEALGLLEGTGSGALLARFIRNHVRGLYFFDPATPPGRPYARFDGVWNRDAREIGINGNLSRGVTDYLVSVLAHEGSHAMNASRVAERLARASSVDEYVALMIEDERRAYTAQARVWRELRQRLPLFRRLVWVNDGDVWMEEVETMLDGGPRFARWLEQGLKYGQFYWRQGTFWVSSSRGPAGSLQIGKGENGLDAGALGGSGTRPKDAGGFRKGAPAD